MALANWFERKSRIFGISYFIGDELEIAFLESVAGHFRFLNKEKLSKAASIISEAERTDFRSRLKTHQIRSPIWIHLVLRNVAFVKVFSLPKTPPEEIENILADRIHTETPYLTEEVVLHHRVQEGKEGEAFEVLLLGVSKAVLMEQMKKLESYGIVPDRVMLTTDILRWFYRTEIYASRSIEGSSVLAHWFGRQVELLFFMDQSLIQSRWAPISAEGVGAENIAEAIQASFAAFQREWRRKPDQVFLLGATTGEAESFPRDLAVPFEHIPFREEEGTLHYPLFDAAARLWRSEELFDFRLPELSAVQERDSRARKRSKIATSVAALSLSLFFLGLLQVSAMLGCMLWYWLRAQSFEPSVNEIKGVRAKALAVKDFQTRKAIPLVLLSTLRSAIPDTLFLRELQYDESQSKLLIRGVAPEQKQIEQFVGSLERHDLFEGLSLKNVQAERTEQGSDVYYFSVEGSVRI